MSSSSSSDGEEWLTGARRCVAVAAHIQTEYHDLRAGAAIATSMTLVLPPMCRLRLEQLSPVSEAVAEAAKGDHTPPLLGGIRLLWSGDWEQEGALALLMGRMGRYGARWCVCACVCMGVAAVWRRHVRSTTLTSSATAAALLRPRFLVPLRVRGSGTSPR